MTGMNEDIGLFARQEQEEKLRKAQEAQRKELEKAIADVMSTKQGRRVMSWILSITGLKSSVTSTNPMTMAIASARRDVGISISQAIENICPESYLLMNKEEKAWMNRSKTL